MNKTKSKIESMCCGAQMTSLDYGTIIHKGKHYCLELCPECWCYCNVKESGRERSKIFHAALQLLKNIYKGMIITIAICFLLPALLIVLIATHVICISDKIKLIPISRIRSNLKEMR